MHLQLVLVVLCPDLNDVVVEEPNHFLVSFDWAFELGAFLIFGDALQGVSLVRQLQVE